MIRLLTTALLTATLAIAAAAPAGAQMRGACLPHETAVTKLEKGYGEQRVGLGVGPSGGAIYELYVADTGTWTILVTRPNGLSCIAASGDSWMTSSPLLAGDPT